MTSSSPATAWPCAAPSRATGSTLPPFGGAPSSGRSPAWGRLGRLAAGLTLLGLAGCGTLGSGGRLEPREPAAEALEPSGLERPAETVEGPDALANRAPGSWPAASSGSGASRTAEEEALRETLRALGRQPPAQSGSGAERPVAGSSGGVQDDGSGPGAEVGTEVGIQVGTEAGAEVGTEAGTEAGTEVGTEAGAEVGTEAGTETGTEVGTEAGTEVGTEGGIQADTDEGLRVGSDEAPDGLPDALPDALPDSLDEVGADDAGSSGGAEGEAVAAPLEMLLDPPAEIPEAAPDTSLAEEPGPTPEGPVVDGPRPPDDTALVETPRPPDDTAVVTPPESPLARAEREKRNREEVAAVLDRLASRSSRDAETAFRDLWEAPADWVEALIDAVQDRRPSGLASLQIFVLDRKHFEEGNVGVGADGESLVYRLPGMGALPYDDIAVGPSRSGRGLKIVLRRFRASRFTVGEVVRAGLFNRFRSMDYPAGDDTSDLVGWWRAFRDRVKKSL